MSVWEGFDADDRGTAYRWHIPDPVRFRESLKVTIEHKGVLFKPDGKVATGFGERADYFSSVAFWYQKGRAKRFATLPPGYERIVPGGYVEAESRVESIRSAPVKATVQKGGVWSGDAQIFFTPPDKDAWLEIDFEVPEDGRYALKADITRSWDYGIYEIQLDGKTVGGSRNLRHSTVIVRPEKLRTQQLTQGKHTLRFVCVGRDPESRIRPSGEPGYYFGLDGISFRRLFPRK